MSDETQTVKTGLSSAQVYLLSVICLLIGITMGYLFRGSNAPKSAATSGSNAAGPLTGKMTQPSADDMKRMADKQVAPLLEKLKSDPKNTELLSQVAHYYMVANQFNDAAAYYEKVVPLKPTAENLTNLANAYYYAGSGEKAIDALKRALVVDPKYPDALYNLGMLEWQLNGDTKGAIASWEKLVKTNPNHPQVEEVKKMITRAKEHSKVAPGTKTDKPAM
jgi:cytochrome c-type biogenesis protein CcmH/NrfG